MGEDRITLSLDIDRVTGNWSELAGNDLSEFNILISIGYSFYSRKTKSRMINEIRVICDLIE